MKRLTTEEAFLDALGRDDDGDDVPLRGGDLETKRLKACPEIYDVSVGSEWSGASGYPGGLWSGGSRQSVSWSHRGDVPKVKVALYEGQRMRKYVGRDVANTGSYTFTVPIGLRPGNYCVRVESTANHNVYCSSANVQIDRDRTPPAILNVTTTSEWSGGSRQLVTWRHEGDVPSVNLALLKGRGPWPTYLGESVANTGSLTITVPMGLVPGDDYHVYIDSSASEDVCAESPLISIDSDRTPPAVLNVTIGREWSGGSRQLVTWSHTGDVPEVQISIYRHNICVESLEFGVANTGSCTISVPIGLLPGYYCVRVESMASVDVYGSSANVQIDRGCTPPAIFDVATRQSLWHGASHQLVTWTSKGTVPGVYLSLHKGGRFFKLLVAFVANTGSCTITVPKGLTPGDDYCVHIASKFDDQHLGSKDVFADSPPFTIDDEHRERCVRYALGLLGRRLPYAVLKKICVAAATT